MATNADLLYLERGGTGVESIQDLEFAYWAGLSGLTPAEEYSVSDHKQAALA